MAKSGKEVTRNALRSMAFLTSEMITQFAVSMTPKGNESTANSVDAQSGSHQDQVPPPLPEEPLPQPPSTPI